MLAAAAPNRAVMRAARVCFAEAKGMRGLILSTRGSLISPIRPFREAMIVRRRRGIC
jgi:hypothetical protein